MTDVLAKLTMDHFQRRADSTFRLSSEGFSCDLIIKEVVPVGGVRTDPAVRMQAFSVLFEGPPEPLLNQGTYQLSEAQLGRMDLFLVPVGRSESGVRYEAVFT